MADPRRAATTGIDVVDRNFKMVMNILTELKPINLGAKNANFIQTSRGIDTAQNISPEASPQFQSIGAGVQPKSGLSFTVKDKTSIGTQTFNPSWRKGSGWSVDYEAGEYNAYFDNVQINGNLRAKTYILDELRINNGDELWTHGAKVAKTDGSTWFDVEDPNETGGNPFAADDVIENRSSSIGATYSSGEFVDDGYLIKRLIYKVSSVSGLRVNLTSVSGAPTNKGSIKKGDTFVRNYNETDATRRGTVGIYATGENNPYIEIRDGASSWATHRSDDRIYFRAGKLDGVNLSGTFPTLDGTQTNTYGTIIKGNVFIQGEILITNPEDIDTSSLTNDAGWTAGANWATNLSGIPSTLSTPSGAGLYLSATHLGYYDSSTWKTYMDNSGNFYLGGTGGALTWAAGSNTLTITNGVIASPTLTSVSGSITLTLDNGQIGWNIVSVGSTALASYQADVGDAGLTTDYMQATGYFTGIYRDAAETVGTSGYVLRSNGTTGYVGAQLSYSDLGGSLPSHTNSWGNITSTPTTISGYGITDAALGSDSGTPLWSFALTDGDLKFFGRQVTLPGTGTTAYAIYSITLTP